MLEKTIAGQLIELGIPEEITSVDSLLEQWENLTEEQQTKGYFLLSNDEEDKTTINDKIVIDDYVRKYHSDVKQMRQTLFSIDGGVGDCSRLPDGTSCLIAEDKNRAVGYLLYEDGEGVRQIREVFVNPEYRQKKVMSRLFHSVEGELPLALFVRKDRLETQEAFRRYGFEIEGTSVSNYYLMLKMTDCPVF